MYLLLNPFPIQFLSLFAYFLLRVITGYILVSLGRRHLRLRHQPENTITFPLLPVPSWHLTVLAVYELVCGLLIIIGAYTQYAALGILAYCTYCILFHHTISLTSFPPRVFFVLLFGVALSLFITGAGALAVDLPI